MGAALDAYLRGAGCIEGRLAGLLLIQNLEVLPPSLPCIPSQSPVRDFAGSTFGVFWWSRSVSEGNLGRLGWLAAATPPFGAAFLLGGAAEGTISPLLPMSG